MPGQVDDPHQQPGGERAEDRRETEPVSKDPERERKGERGTHAQLYAARGRYYDLYTRQHGVENNLFLAPGEGDTFAVNGDSADAKNGDVKGADALRVLRGEMR